MIVLHFPDFSTHPCYWDSSSLRWFCLLSNFSDSSLGKARLFSSKACCLTDKVPFSLQGQKWPFGHSSLAFRLGSWGHSALRFDFNIGVTWHALCLLASGGKLFLIPLGLLPFSLAMLKLASHSILWEITSSANFCLKHPLSPFKTYNFYLWNY